MRKFIMLFALSVSSAFLSSPLYSADMAALQWGEFNAVSDGPATATATVTNGADQESNVGLKILELIANAEGTKTDSSSNFSGNFAVDQPKFMPIKKVDIDVSGVIIKTNGTTAKINITIGDTVKTVEWPAEKEIAESFTTTITIDLPDGRLPSPFPVTANVQVNKPSDSGSALVSIKEINMRVGAISTASTQ